MTSRTDIRKWDLGLVIVGGRCKVEHTVTVVERGISEESIRHDPGWCNCIEMTFILTGWQQSLIDRRFSASRWFRPRRGRWSDGRQHRPLLNTDLNVLSGRAVTEISFLCLLMNMMCLSSKPASFIAWMLVARRQRGVRLGATCVARDVRHKPGKVILVNKSYFNRV